MKKSIFGLITAMLSAAVMTALAGCLPSGVSADKKETKPAVKAKAKTGKKAAARKAAAKKKAEKKTVLAIALDNPSGFYKKGDTVKYTVSFLKDGKQLAGQKVGYAVSPAKRSKKYTVFTTTDKPEVLSFKMDQPWITIQAAQLDDKGKPTKITACTGVIASPFEIKPGFNEPADFQKYWDTQLKALAKVPVKELERKEVSISKWADKNFRCWDVKVQCLGEKPVSGYLVIPKNAKEKSLPAIVSFHGAGVYSANKSVVSNAITLDVNAHGILNGQPKEYYKSLTEGALKNYRLFNADNRDKFYFHDMFMRVKRALDYVKTLPEWNGRDLIVQGGSQGGMQTLFAAAFDPQVTLIYANVPASCDLGSYKAGRVIGWPFVVRLNKEKADPQVESAIVYYDCALFAKRIKAEAYLTTGLMDNCCPPTSVFAAFNSIPGKKEINVFPEQGHAGRKPSPGFKKRLDEILKAKK